MTEILVEDKFPEYYIKIKASYVRYVAARPDIFVEVDAKRQYYVLKKDIPDDILRWRLSWPIENGISDMKSIMADLSIFNGERIDGYIDLFIKFDSHSEMIKWKLKNG